MKPRHVRARPTPRAVRDYEAIDRQDRVIAGPFKSYGDAKDAAGSAGAVRFVPKGKRAAEMHAQAKLPERLHDAFNWIDSAGEWQEALATPSTYAFAAAKNAQRNGERSVTRGDLIEVIEWVQAHPNAKGSRGPLLPHFREAPRVKEDDAEAAGAAYAQEQLESDHFMDWVREQLLEASKMPASDVLPLEDKHDAKIIARNMLQQLEWDTRREHHESAEFYKGFREALDGSRDWLAEELLRMNQEIKGVGEARPKAREVRTVAGEKRTVELYNLFRPGSQSPSNGYMVRVVSNGQTRFVKFGRHSDKAAAFARGVAPEPSKEEQKQLELDTGPTRPKAKRSVRRRR